MRAAIFFCFIAAPLALAASIAGAQPTQSAGRVGQVGGACGQPLGLTFTLPLALDEAAMAPLNADIVRAEPLYLEFVLTSETRVVMRTDTTDPSTDPYLALFDTSGQVLAEDDDGAGGYNALVDVTLAPGTYCAQIQPYDAAQNRIVPMTLLAATGQAAQELAGRVDSSFGADLGALCADPSQTTRIDRAIGPGFGNLNFTATVDPQARQDWSFTVATRTAFQADAVSPDFDTVLVLALDGALLAENDDGYNMGTDSRIALELDPGEYCLSVSGYEGGGGAVQIAITDTPEIAILGDITTACTDPALTTDFGRPLGTGFGAHTVDGTLAIQSRADFTIEVTDPVTFQFDARSEAFDTLLTLLDTNGTVIEENDDGPNTGVDSRITRALEPGRYCLAVAALGDAGEGPFSLSATDSIEPAPVDLGAIQACSDPQMTISLEPDLAPGFGVLTAAAGVPPNRRQDWTLTVTAPMELLFDARSNEFDTVLRISDMTGYVIAENDDAPTGGSNSQIESRLNPGSYCLSLEGFAGDGGAAEIAVTELDEATLGQRQVSQGLVAPGPDSGVEIDELGPLVTALQSNRITLDQTKWMAFSLDGEGEVRIDAVSMGGGFTLRLYDEAGVLIQSADGYAGLSPTQISERLAPGRYVLGMTLNDAAGSNLRSVSITRVNAR